MALTAGAVYDHVLALRSSLDQNRWASSVDPQVLAIFNELLTATQKLAPGDQVLRAIKRPKDTVRPTTLLTLVSQMLVAINPQHASLVPTDR